MKTIKHKCRWNNTIQWSIPHFAWKTKCSLTVTPFLHFSFFSRTLKSMGTAAINFHLVTELCKPSFCLHFRSSKDHCLPSIYRRMSRLSVYVPSRSWTTCLCRALRLSDRMQPCRFPNQVRSAPWNKHRGMQKIYFNMLDSAYWFHNGKLYTEINRETHR